MADVHTPVQTVNPSSLSPEMRPVDESSNASSSDMTQHPAAVLCDLQCQSEEQRPWMNSKTTTTSNSSQISALFMLLSMTSVAFSTLVNPMIQITTSLKTGSSLSPTASILTMIIWMVTTITPLTTLTSMTTSTSTTRQRYSLRISMLRRLLACSPNLARPLKDATMAAMRSASEQQLTHACLSDVGARRFDVSSSSSIEALTTLLWVIHVIERERKQQMIPELDAATEVRQACSELDELFRHRTIKTKRISYPSGADEGMRTKTLEGWRTAYKHDRS